MTSEINKFLSAAEVGDLAMVQDLLDGGLGVDAFDEDGVTALQVAAANGQEDVVRLLLMRGAALEKSNVHGWSALMQSARHGHTVIMGLLLQHKADPDRRSLLGGNALLMAARGGHTAAVRLLLDAGAETDPCGTLGDFTPLIPAVAYGYDSVTKLLLDRGFDANYRMLSTGTSSLMFSATNGHMTTCQLLVDRGCDLNAVDICERTSLDLAVMSNKREVQGYLERKTTYQKRKAEPIDRKPNIMEASKIGNTALVMQLVNADPALVNLTDRDGATALMYAAMMGKLDTCEFLIQRGADINKQDLVSGWTALMQAVYHGRKAVMKYLLNAGAEVTVQAKNGCTAFDLASLIDDIDTDVVRLLAAAMVKVSKAPKIANTPAQAWVGGMSTSTPVLTSVGVDATDSKGGLKLWWNRMSNRFRQLKLGRTFRLSTNQLAPLPMETANQETSFKKPSPDIENFDTSQVDTIDTLLLENTQNSLFSLANIGPHSNTNSETLKPVIPPFLPPPTFELSESHRAKMPMGSRKKLASISSTVTMSPNRKRKVVKPYKFLSTTSISPSNSARFSAGISSPSSSGGASSIPLYYRRRMPNSYSMDNFQSGIESTLQIPEGSVLNNSSQYGLSSPARYGRTQRSPMFRNNVVSPISYACASTTLTPRKSSTLSSTSRSSTLTPDPSSAMINDISKSSSETLSNESPNSAKKLAGHSSSSDELSQVLKKLSLAKYRPIFEEQEVDMEAFLTLTDDDLKEIGISQADPRRKILSAISELQSGKGKERQMLHETVKNFQSGDAPSKGERTSNITAKTDIQRSKKSCTS